MFFIRPFRGRARNLVANARNIKNRGWSETEPTEVSASGSFSPEGAEPSATFTSRNYG